LEAMKNVNAADISPFLAGASWWLSAAGVVCAIVGLVASWASAQFSAGPVSGTGRFTLWEIVVEPKASLFGAVFSISDVTFGIDDTLCGSAVKFGELVEVCRAFDTMRICAVVALIAAILAFVGVSAVAGSVFCGLVGDTAARWSSAFAAALSGVAWIAALVAVIEAATMPSTSEIKDVTSPGAGAICTGALIVLGLLAMALEATCWCRSQAPKAREVGVTANV